MQRTLLKHPIPIAGSTRWLGHIATAMGIVVALVGAGHLWAWLSGYMAPQGISSITLKTNTALALLLLGVALIVIVPPNITLSRCWAGRVLAILPALIGFLSLSENLLGWDLRIDQLLANEPAGSLGVAAPNLMGIPAAISFVLAGLALLIFSRRDGRGATAAQGLALAICFIALLGTIGYLYGAHVLYAVAHLTGIAWPTALALLTLGLGLLLARPTEGLMAQVTADDPGGANLRRWVPVMLLPAVLGWLRLAGERQGVFDAATGTAIMMIIFIVCLAVLAYAGSRPVSRSLADLRESEERYRSLFGSMAEAFALHEILTDAGGQPIDYRFLEVNDSFERMTGLKRSDVVGRTVREVLPKIDHSWIETYGRVALTGEAVNFEKYYPAPLNRWYEVFAYQPAPRQFAAVFLDVSQRKRSEEELRASETRLRRFYESGRSA